MPFCRPIIEAIRPDVSARIHVTKDRNKYYVTCVATITPCGLPPSSRVWTENNVMAGTIRCARIRSRRPSHFLQPLTLSTTCSDSADYDVPRAPCFRCGVDWWRDSIVRRTPMQSCRVPGKFGGSELQSHQTGSRMRRTVNKLVVATGDSVKAATTSQR
jgi:hypothetical protein